MKREKIIGLLMIVAVLMASCINDDEYATQGEPVNVELAYALSSRTSQITRQATDVLTSDATSPRLPYYTRIIPMVNNDPVSAEVGWDFSVVKDNPNSRFYRSHFCSLDIGTNGFLVYANVLDRTPVEGIDIKMYNGSLIETFPSSISDVHDVDEGISFSLDPIYKSADYSSTNGIPSGAKALADCLTAIATKEGFHESLDPTVKGFFDLFTNDGNHLPGSAVNVRKWIETFRTSMSSHLNPSEPSVLDAVDAEAVIRLTDIASLTYPRDINLPDGAAVLRWNKNTNKFEPQINTTTIDNINSIARFAYPAPLYYFVASDIKTSEKLVDFATLYNQVESNNSKTAWEQVLENETFNKTSVSANTMAVVLKQPIQFAIAQVKVKIKAYSSYLPDAATPTPNSIAANGTNFPLKGIIVCDQRPVDYEFEPKDVEQGVVSDADVLFIYDNQVKSDCYLTTQTEGVWAEGCNTLVLQSLKDEDVNIILEFENNSGQQFTCIDGIVYPGTRFYLIGKVEASLYNSQDPNVHSENKDQVFTKDYITTVNMTVSSLARAYNVPPNLLSPNLEIGVETTPEWEEATPTVIRLE